MSTLHYGDNRLAMYIDSVQRTDRVTAQRIANEAVGWGLSRERATAIVGDVLDRAPTAMAAAAEEADGVPNDLVATIERQLTQLRSTE
jgi:hypothetical protein